MNSQLFKGNTSLSWTKKSCSSWRKLQSCPKRATLSAASPLTPNLATTDPWKPKFSPAFRMMSTMSTMTMDMARNRSRRTLRRKSSTSLASLLSKPLPAVVAAAKEATGFRLPRSLGRILRRKRELQSLLIRPKIRSRLRSLSQRKRKMLSFESSMRGFFRLWLRSEIS